LRNRVQGTLAALRQEKDQLAAQLAAVKDATQARKLSSDLGAKEAEIARLNNEYKNLFEDNTRLENDLKEARLGLVKSRDRISDLEGQIGAMGSATESQTLKSEVTALREQLARAGSTPGEGGKPEESLFLLNNTLGAVRHALAGEKAEALSLLRKVESKAPKGSTLQETIDLLKPAQPPQETSASTTPVPEPTPTARQPESKPTQEPAPTKRAVADSGRTGGGDPGVAKARPIRGRKPPSVQPEPAATTEDIKQPKRRVPLEPDRESRIQRLQKRKEDLTDRALALYKERRPEEAWRAIEEAYRIDPKDPRVNQLRDAIRKQRG